MLLWESFRVFKANVSKYVHFPFLTQMARLCTAGFSPNIMSQRCFHFIIYHLHLVISYVVFHSVDVLVHSGCYHKISQQTFISQTFSSGGGEPEIRVLACVGEGSFQVTGFSLYPQVEGGMEVSQLLL